MAKALGRPAVAAAHQYRHQFIVQFDQGRVGVDIDHVDRESGGRAGSGVERLQRLQQVVAQVAIAARIESEVICAHALLSFQ